MYEMLIGQSLNQTANHLISHLVVALVYRVAAVLLRVYTRCCVVCHLTV